MDDINTTYVAWCKSIAESRDIGGLIAHLREHVGDHYDRHQRAGKVSLDVWLAGVLNFMNILREKDHGLTVEDLLFKLCTYFKNHRDGPAPPVGFDVDTFLAEYQGPFKKFYTSN